MTNFLRRKKKKKAKKIFILIILIFVLFLFWYVSVVNNPISDDTTVRRFIVEPGWGSTKISEELEQAGLIKNAYAFQLYVWKNKIDSKLQDGEFLLSENQNLKEIAELLNRGAGASKEVSLTLLEGWGIKEMAAYLDEQGVSSEKEFSSIVQKKAPWWDEYTILNSKPRNLDLEGYLYPDTYRVFRDSNATDVVKKMLDNLEIKITPELLAEIDKQGKTVHEILTLASILEREVRSEQDRKKVADIFYKRIKAGIALQADSTVNYATGKNNPQATYVDLEVDSLYNTYKYRGLPPGPIANPSISSIRAAIYPESNPYFYFLTTPQGEVIYNIDFDGHVEDKHRYLN